MDIELTILMPCLNEAETIAACIQEAQDFLNRYNIKGEVLISDNGSTDGSQDIARDLGARVIDAPLKGYGAALSTGIAAARGDYVIMGDADHSYNFAQLDMFVDKLRAGADLVMGNRFQGGIEKAAMPFLHRYLGNPILSFFGRLFFKTQVGDFHCGLRGFARERVRRLGLKSTGMEFASEMVVSASLAGYKIEEVPTTLRRDGRSRSPHLHTWRDGWRHLRFLLMYSPRWLFLYPGLVLFLFGVVISGILLSGPIVIGNTMFDIHTLMATSISVLVGLQLISFSLISKRIGVRCGYLPKNQAWENFYNFTLEQALLLSLFLIVIGISGMGWTLAQWAQVDFGDLEYPLTLRVFLVSLILVVAALQIGFSAFLSAIIDAAIVQNKKHPAHTGIDS